MDQSHKSSVPPMKKQKVLFDNGDNKADKEKRCIVNDTMAPKAEVSTCFRDLYAVLLDIVIQFCNVQELVALAQVSKAVKRQSNAERRQIIQFLQGAPWNVTSMRQTRVIARNFQRLPMKAFSLACSRGALPALDTLHLRGSEIGDEGMIKLSESLAMGAMAHLRARSLPTTLSASP